MIWRGQPIRDGAVLRMPWRMVIMMAIRLLLDHRAHRRVVIVHRGRMPIVVHDLAIQRHY